MEEERIPYNTWANSQLSIAKYYGGININGKHYLLDYDNCPTKEVNGETKYFPDLVLESKIKNKSKKVSKKDISKVVDDFFKSN